MVFSITVNQQESPAIADYPRDACKDITRFLYSIQTV